MSPPMPQFFGFFSQIGPVGSLAAAFGFSYGDGAGVFLLLFFAVSFGMACCYGAAGEVLCVFMRKKRGDVPVHSHTSHVYYGWMTPPPHTFTACMWGSVCVWKKS